MDQKVIELTINRNKFELGDLYSALVQKFAFGRFEGTFGVEFNLSTPWLIDTILGAAVTTGAGPYTHTYDDTKTVRAFTTEVGVDTTTDRVIQLQKCTARELTISWAINEMVKCKFNGQAGAATVGTVLDSTPQVDDILYPYSVVQATLENPSGTPLALVQSAEMTLNPNITYRYGPNNTDAQAAVKGKLMISGRFTLDVVDNTWWNNVMAGAEPANNTLRFKFSNGLAGTSERTIHYTLTGLGFGELSMPISQYETIVEEIPFTARDIQAVAINNTATPP